MKKKGNKKTQSHVTVVEGVIKHICERPFLNDFIFLRAKRVDNGNEFTDLLLILDNSCVCVEIKTSNKIRLPNDLINWVNTKLAEAHGQLIEGFDAVMKSSLTAKHGWQGRVTFNTGAFRVVAGISLIDYTGPPILVTPYDNMHSGIPIHHFSISDFLDIANLLGTLPDIFKYLEQRKLLPEEIRSTIGNEADIIGEYFLNERLSSSLTLSDIAGKWQYLITKYGPAYERKLRYDEYVLFYNGIIAELHREDAELQKNWPKELVKSSDKPRDKRKYLQIATQLNKLPLIYRRTLGKRIITAANNAEKFKKSRCFYGLDNTQQWVYAFLFTLDMDRERRIRNLMQLAATACVKANVKNCIAIACPSVNSLLGFDYLFYENVRFDDPRLKELVALEPDLKITTSRAFPDPEDDVPPVSSLDLQ